MKIAIDFDGTCVEHMFPAVGKDVPGAMVNIRRLIEDGHEIYLYTMRSGSYLGEAVKWFRDRNLFLSGINTDPSQTSWTNSPKCYAGLYIDDAAFGAPLRKTKSGRMCLDWSGVLDAVKNATPNPIVDLEEIRYE